MLRKAGRFAAARQERFYRVNRLRNRYQQGAGSGLGRSVTLGLLLTSTLALLASVVGAPSSQADGKENPRTDVGGKGSRRRDGRQLFEQETFGGNGRTCLTCHRRKTGTLSPEEARPLRSRTRNDPLFLHDGSDDCLGKGLADPQRRDHPRAHPCRRTSSRRRSGGPRSSCTAASRDAQHACARPRADARRA